MRAPWHAGEMVRGEVIAIRGAITVLRVDGMTVATDSTVPGVMPPRFEALVVTGGPRPVLEVIADGPREPSPYTAILRSRLAQQGGIQPLLADLNELGALAGIGDLSEPLRIALARLEASVANRDDLLDADLIRDALQRSGVQLEYSLATRAASRDNAAATSAEYDFKGALERLMAALPGQGPRVAAAATPASLPALRDLPLEAQPRAGTVPDATDVQGVLAAMLAHARAAHARIEVMQADAAEARAPYACMAEVPVRGRGGFDVLQVRIRPPGAGGDEPQWPSPEWIVEFTYAPPELDTVQGQICLCATRASVDLWAERERTVVALEGQADALLELLRVSGLTMPQVRVHHGMPVRHTGFERRILDTVV